MSLSWLTTLFLSPYLSRAFRLPECKFVDEVLAGSFLDELPVRLIGDKAYDSAKLDRQLKNEYGVEMIAPNRCTAANTGPEKTSLLQKAMEGRTALRLDAQLPETRHPMGVPH